MKDKEVLKIINAEEERQLRGIELIASENYVSDDVLEAMGSIMTNKYAEGYPGHRYYGGCVNIDKVEQLAIDRVCRLYDAAYANVQPHSGSQANRAVIEAVCEPGDTILSLDLNNGGHLTHGSPVSFSGKYYDIVSYNLKDDDTIDYDDMIEKASIHMPKLIIGGASAYSREWNYDKLVEAKRASIKAQSENGVSNPYCILMFDMAHTAGLIAANLLKNPVQYCDIVTSTTHKTLRGPRGGIILVGKDFINPKNETKKDGTLKMMSEVLNSSVFPQNQGGPLEHIIAAKAVCFQEALQPKFVDYQKLVTANTKILATELANRGYKIVSGGTDNHLILVDLRTKFPEISGKDAEQALQLAEITTNKNIVPNDTRSPFKTSGLRLGCAAISTRGFRKNDVEKIAKCIDEVLTSLNERMSDNIDEEQYSQKIEEIRMNVMEITKHHPLFSW